MHSLQPAIPLPPHLPHSQRSAVSVDEILQMTPEEYETELRQAGRSDEHITQTLQDFEQNKADVLRWREQFEVHWPNVEAFGEVQHNFATDKTISKEEFEHICFVKQQWQDQTNRSTRLRKRLP